MSAEELSRREFHRMAAAAFGGIVAGSMVGCGEAAKEPPKGASKPAPGTETKPDLGSGSEAPGDKTELAAAEPHACRGLNNCKTDKNACAGQSTCANVMHDCAGMNECKNQGGCGKNPGTNDCKEKGGCAVPMKAEHGDAWKTARKSFEERLTKAGKKFGPAPEAAEPEKAEKPEEKKEG